MSIKITVHDRRKLQNYDNQEVMIVIVRHGAREDDVPNRKRKSEVIYDPSLSSLGEDQSHITGKYIANKFMSNVDNRIENTVMIISSPFLRTLQTAVIIAREINCTKVHVWDPMCEELKDDLFDCFPLPGINFYMHDIKILGEKFFKGNDVEITKIEDPDGIILPCHYPEKKENKMSNIPVVRAQNALDYLIKTFFSRNVGITNPSINKTGIESSPEVLILVGHAFFLSVFVKHFSPQTNCKDRNYCALSVAKMMNYKEWKLVQNCSSEHLI